MFHELDDVDVRGNSDSSLTRTDARYFIFKLFMSRDAAATQASAAVASYVSYIK